MSTVAERYKAAADHFYKTKTHAEGQEDAFTEADANFRMLTEHKGNSLLEGSPSRQRELQSATEKALSNYEKFM